MQGPDGPLGGNPFRHIDRDVRWMVADFEEKDDFEGAIEHLRWLADRVDSLGCCLGEEDRGKGNLRNVAMTMRGRASFADRSHWQAVMYDIRDATGIWIPWRKLREHGVETAYALAREGAGDDRVDEEYWA